jgi:hypothetical protein
MAGWAGQLASGVDDWGLGEQNEAHKQKNRISAGKFVNLDKAIKKSKESDIGGGKDRPGVGWQWPATREASTSGRRRERRRTAGGDRRKSERGDQPASTSRTVGSRGGSRSRSRSAVGSAKDANPAMGAEASGNGQPGRRRQRQRKRDEKHLANDAKKAYHTMKIVMGARG